VDTAAAHLELPATAALPHATTGTPIAQMLTCQDGQIVIEITDPSPDPPVLADAGPDAEAGRGLLLVQALAKEWACCYRTCGGKTVRCALPLPDITTQPAPPAAPPPGP
jgi:serine/threonine-protein kinase RsbW